MTDIKLQKRGNDFFVSYGHGDLSRVTPAVNWLRRTCGLQIWFDGVEGNAAMRSSELLELAIGNSRGALFFLSENWKKSSWCRDEYEYALVQRRAHKGFELVVLRLDDSELPGWCQVAETIDFKDPQPPVMAKVLRSLSSDVPHRFDNSEDVYLAAPWSRPTALVETTFGLLRRTGWRLVGDTPNRKDLGVDRIKAIQQTTRGVIAVLPSDPAQEIGTSPFIVREAEMAIDLKKLLLVLVEPGVSVSAEIVEKAFRKRAFQLEGTEKNRNELNDLLDEFDSALRHVSHDDTGAYIFFASSLTRDQCQVDDIVSVVQRASNMECSLGERLSGENVQLEIVDRIRRAAVVIADVSDDHRNTLIEAGIAMGAGTNLKLICQKGVGDPFPKKRFMFEGQEYHWYSSPEEKLGLCYFFARQFRRQIYVVR